MQQAVPDVLIAFMVATSQAQAEATDQRHPSAASQPISQIKGNKAKNPTGN